MRVGLLGVCLFSLAALGKDRVDKARSPMTDGPIAELYLPALDWHAKTGRDPVIHIFPRRLDDAGMAALEGLGDPSRLEFWKQLKPAFDAFEKSRKVPSTRVN